MAYKIIFDMKPSTIQSIMYQNITTLTSGNKKSFLTQFLNSSKIEFKKEENSK